MSKECYRVVYPDGRVELIEAEPPEIGYDLGGYRVDFISLRQEKPTVYLGLHYGQQSVVKLVFLVVAGEKCPLTMAESAEIGERPTQPQCRRHRIAGDHRGRSIRATRRREWRQPGDELF